MKNIFCLLMVLMLVFAFAACKPAEQEQNLPENAEDQLTDDVTADPQEGIELPVITAGQEQGGDIELPEDELEQDGDIELPEDELEQNVPTLPAPETGEDTPQGSQSDVPAETQPVQETETAYTIDFEITLPEDFFE